MGTRTVRHWRWRVVAGVIAGIMAVTLAPTVPATPVAAHPGLASKIFDPDEVPWSSLRGQTPTEFTNALADHRENGNIPVDVEADVRGDSDLRYGGAFQRNLDNRNWLVDPVLTSSQLNDLVPVRRDQRMRPADFETFVRSGRRHYTVLWVENREGYHWWFKYGLTGSEAQGSYEELKATHLPVDVNLWETGAGMRYAVIWLENGEKLGWRIRFDRTNDELQKEIDTYGDRYRALVVDSARTKAGQRYALIMHENRNHRYWKIRWGLTDQEYSNWWYRYRDMGYRPINVVEYQTAAGTRFAGIWRQNTPRPSWPLRDDVDKKVSNLKDALDMPGISVAVMQNGQFLYLRGFGDADEANGVKLDSRHVMRLASVAKAVGGVLTMRLAEQGKVDPGEDVTDMLPLLPSHHTYTLEQVMSNRACVRHYASVEEDDGYPVPDEWYDQDSTLRNTSYGTAVGASIEFWGGELVCTVEDSHYSTHGYTIGAAAMEWETGIPVADMVVDELTDPFDLGTLRPEDMTDTSVRRTVLYNGSNDPVATPDEVSWKVLGGGLEASVYDLAWFGNKLLSEQIVDVESLEAMWDGAPWSYAYGWSHNWEDGHLRVYKNGGATGATSYLQLYPDDGITIAVTMNRSDGDPDVNWAQQLGQAIGADVLKTLP